MSYPPSEDFYPTEADPLAARQSPCPLPPDSPDLLHMRVQIADLEKQLQEAQELSDLNTALLMKLAEDIRQPLSNIAIALRMLKGATSEAERDRYIAILDEECARELALLNEVTGLQELLHSSRLNVLRQLKVMRE